MSKLEEENVSYGDYKRIVSLRNHIQQTIVSDFPELVTIIEETLAFTQKIIDILEKKLFVDTHPNKVNTIKINLFSRNYSYLSGSYILFRSNLILPAMGLLRVVLENIHHLYVHHFFKKDSDLLFDYHKLSKKQLTSTLTSDESNTLSKLRKKYTPINIRKLLYGNIDEHNKFYWSLCEYSHPTTVGFSYDRTYIPNSMENALKVLLHLIDNNLYAILIIYEPILSSEEKKMMYEMLHKIRNIITVFDLSPNAININLVGV